jgi:hypothetical protein
MAGAFRIGYNKKSMLIRHFLSLENEPLIEVLKAKPMNGGGM